jgi:putative NADH-flavin reductase
MHLTVFGATGTVGRLLVQQALGAGHEVTAFTRDAAKVTTRHERLAVVAGDVTDPASVLPAVEGAGAVVVTLGAGRHGVVREAGTRAVITAMHRAGVRRLVVQSTLGVGDSRANLNFFWKRVMFGLVLRQAYADHVRQEEAVRESGLDWTIVRPSAFTDEAVPGVRHGFGTDTDGLRLKVSRADVAAFLLTEAERSEHLHDAVALSA